MMDKGQQDALRKALISISKLRQDVGEKSFRELLLSLKASTRSCKCAGELARSFDEESGHFIKPYQRMGLIIGNDQNERRKFRRAVYNFKPGSKGQRGGLKQYAAKLRQERDDMANLLKRYYKLDSVRLKLGQKRASELTEIKKIIPVAIQKPLLGTKANKQGNCRPAYREFAVKWMSRYYPCTQATLTQIIRESSADTEQ
jgi:hypothetical protein